MSPPRAFTSITNAAALRIRFALVLNNVGAWPVVDGLRIVVDGEELEYGTTRKTIRVQDQDVVDFATPFAVAGRTAREMVVEFGDPRVRWRPEPGRVYSFTLERLTGGQWRKLVTFDWYAPTRDPWLYVGHYNGPDDSEAPPT